MPFWLILVLVVFPLFFWLTMCEVKEGSGWIVGKIMVLVITLGVIIAFPFAVPVMSSVTPAGKMAGLGYFFLLITFGWLNILTSILKGVGDRTKFHWMIVWIILCGTIGGMLTFLLLPKVEFMNLIEDLHDPKLVHSAYGIRYVFAGGIFGSILGVIVAHFSFLKYRDKLEAAKKAKEAVKWYRKAATQGNAYAQFALGSCYADGSGGLEKDLDMAVVWYRKAAEQGNPQAQQALKQLGETL